VGTGVREPSLAGESPTPPDRMVGRQDPRRGDDGPAASGVRNEVAVLQRPSLIAGRT
jgi:hypothetical protein